MTSSMNRTLSSGMAEVSAVLAAEGPAPDVTLMEPSAGRAEAERANARWNVDLPEMAAVSDLIVPSDGPLGAVDVPLRLLVPHGARPGLVLYVHGGGFAFCSPATHERCARMLAVASGMAVALPAYRLAPEHPFPAGLKDVVSCIRRGMQVVAGHGVVPGPLFLAGDSAGANLALAAMLLDGADAISGALLFYGVYDADFDSESYRFFAEGPGLTRGKMQRYWDWYVADAALRDDPLIAPLKAHDQALKALPPLHLVAAGIDPLLSDSIAFANRLAELGRVERLHIVSGVVHGFLQMSLLLPEARAVLADAGAFIRAHA